MSDEKSDPRRIIFIDRLKNLDVGGRARLRRCAGQRIAEAREIGYFYSLLPNGVPVYQEESYFLVATLYPLAEEGNSGDLGDSLRLSRNSRNQKGLDSRVRFLLDTDEIQLPFRLRQAIRFLKSNRVKINWQQLLDDLLDWNLPNRPVQRRWARSYFAE